jgi:hypothetical protein
VYARVATFESDPANLDDAISMVRAEVESGETPEDLEGAKCSFFYEVPVQTVAPQGDEPLRGGPERRNPRTCRGFDPSGARGTRIPDPLGAILQLPGRIGQKKELI